jgi:citrate lyase beta subunit
VLDRPRQQPDERLLRTLEIVRARFVVEFRAAGVEAIDCLCTFRDAQCCGRRALREEVPIYAVTKRLLATLNDH